MTRSVLITGATGFTGGFLAELYVELGWEVYGTYLEPPHEAPMTSGAVKLVQAELRDVRATRNLVAETRPDLVQHLAGQSSVSDSWRDPRGTLISNALGQLNLLEAVRAESPGSRVVVVGSCDEYGCVLPHENPVAEERALRPVSPYAVSKVTQDLMGYQYATAYRMDVVRVRPFLQVGPRRSDRFVAGAFARQVVEIEMGLRDPVIEVGNIDLVRDFTDVRDVARAFVALGDDGETAQVYNVASGTGHTLRDLLRAMMGAARAGWEIRQEHALQRDGEPRILIGDATRLRSATAWEPMLSFQQSASDTLGYWRSRMVEGQGLGA